MSAGALLSGDDVRGGLRVGSASARAVVGVQRTMSWGQVHCQRPSHLGVRAPRKRARRRVKFLVTGSSAYAASPMAAGLETLRWYKKTITSRNMQFLGERFAPPGLAERAAAHGFGLRQTGHAQMPLFLFDEAAALRHAAVPEQ